MLVLRINWESTEGIVKNQVSRKFTPKLPLPLKHSLFYEKYCQNVGNYEETAKSSLKTRSITPVNFGGWPGIAFSVSKIFKLWMCAIDRTVAATYQGSPRNAQGTIKQPTTSSKSDVKINDKNTNLLFYKNSPLYKSKWYPTPFFNLLSFLLQITAVICWSKTTKIEHNNAGAIA